MSHSTPKGPRKRSRQLKRTPTRVKQPTRAKVTSRYVCPACAGSHLRADCPDFPVPELEHDHDRQIEAYVFASMQRRIPLS